VDADGTVLAAMQVPHVIDPGEGASSSYTFEQLFGAANLPQPVVALVEVEPVELPPERAGGVGPPCLSMQVASESGVEVYAEK
jgi:hypothetical protein